MYGYKNNAWKLGLKLLATGFGFLVLLVLLGVYFVAQEVFKVEDYVVIAVGAVAGAITVLVIFLQIRLSLRRKLEANAIADIQGAMSVFAEASSHSVTFVSDFVSVPMNPPVNFWQDAAYKKYYKVAKQVDEIRQGFGKLYIALETHEIAIIHLEHYYRYITLVIDDFIKLIDSGNTQVLDASFEANFDENAYKLVVNRAFSDVMKELAKISTYMMDFRKIIQTDLLGRVFLRELLPRRPYDGSSTLGQVATKHRVFEMVHAREAEFRKKTS